MHQNICGAINEKRLVEFSYDGYHRQVEPYKLGETTAGNRVLTGYQVAGESSSGNVPGFKMFDITKIWSLSTTSQTFHEPQPEYSRTDERLSRILCQV